MVDIQMSRKEKEDWERKKYIMETAEGLFAANGFAQTSVADIAKASEFGVGTLYKYFNDKETLFHSLIEYRLDMFFDRVTGVFESKDDSVATLRRFFKTYLDFIEEYFEFHKLYFGVVMADAIQGDCWHEKYRNISPKKMLFIEKSLDLFQRAIDEKRLAEIEPRFLLFSMTGMCVTFFHMLIAPEIRGIDVEVIKRNVMRIYFEPVLLESGVKNEE